MPFIIRRAHEEDIEDFHRLARLINSMNLPDKRDALLELLRKSDESFAGKLENPFDRLYVFVMIDSASNKIIGSCQVIAQHGTRDTPHVFLEVFNVEHYSQTINKLFDQQVVRLGFNYDGPTEVGGLVLDPTYRAAPEKLGRQLSLMRFLFIGANRSSFKDKILAEMMPPIGPSGTPVLWDAFGRRFTALDYHEADFISRTNKEFVKALLPDIPIYTCLFDEEVRKSIGAVSKASLPAAHLLESVGLRYLNRVDPFDGGPHMQGDTDSLTVVKQKQTLRIKADDNFDQDSEEIEQGLILLCRDLFTPKSEIRCIEAFLEIGDDDNVIVSKETLGALKAQDDETVHVYVMHQ